MLIRCCTMSCLWQKQTFLRRLSTLDLFHGRSGLDLLRLWCVRFSSSLERASSATPTLLSDSIRLRSSFHTAASTTFMATLNAHHQQVLDPEYNPSRLVRCMCNQL